MKSANDRLMALDELLPSGHQSVVVTSLVTADGEDTLSVGRRDGNPGEYLTVGVRDDWFVLEGREIAAGACPGQAALFVCEALGVSEEFRQYRVDCVVGQGDANA